MINNKNEKSNELVEKDSAPSSEKKPNELGGFQFLSTLKIFDPNTDQIIVQIRGD